MFLQQQTCLCINPAFDEYNAQNFQVKMFILMPEIWSKYNVTAIFALQITIWRSG